MIDDGLALWGRPRVYALAMAVAQVASLANQHLRISKVTDGRSTRTGVAELDTEERVDELARMIGGVEITDKTRAHAAEMLAGAPKKRA